MGRWYVIANIPTFIEKGAHNAIEVYTWNEKKNRVDIDFRFNKDSFDGKLKVYSQKAWIHNTETNAEWRIQPIWPLRFTYLVLDLGKEYDYTVIGVPNRKYIWIMAREPEMDESLYASLIEKARTLWGYDVSLIQKIPQKY
jgi:apolipoprotein D and lipocalin family protein